MSLVYVTYPSFHLQDKADPHRIQTWLLVLRKCDLIKFPLTASPFQFITCRCFVINLPEICHHSQLSTPFRMILKWTNVSNQIYIQRGAVGPCAGCN